MEKPKKQILYKPAFQIETGKQDSAISKINTTPVSVEKPIELKKEDKGDYNGKKMAKWINEASLLNISALCKAAKIDRGNFDKYLKIGEIPKKFLEPIGNIIKKYGYAE